jgi:hypothetical protein
MPYTTLKNELQRTPISSEKIVLEKKEDDIPIENININAFDSIPKLEKKIFSGIINDITLLNEQNRPYIYTLLPHSLTNILKIADRIHQEQPDLGLTSLFDQMEDTQKQMVSHVLLDSDGEVKLHDFERLVAQLQKKHWKTIVNDIKIKLENAKQDGNQEQIEQLIHEFSALKQKMLQKE